MAAHRLARPSECGDANFRWVSATYAPGVALGDFEAYLPATQVGDVQDHVPLPDERASQRALHTRQHDAIRRGTHGRASHARASVSCVLLRDHDLGSFGRDIERRDLQRRDGHVRGADGGPSLDHTGGCTIERHMAPESRCSDDAIQAAAHAERGHPLAQLCLCQDQPTFRRLCRRLEPRALEWHRAGKPVDLRRTHGRLRLEPLDFRPKIGIVDSRDGLPGAYRVAGRDQHACDPPSALDAYRPDIHRLEHAPTSNGGSQGHRECEDEGEHTEEPQDGQGHPCRPTRPAPSRNGARGELRERRRLPRGHAPAANARAHETLAMRRCPASRVTPAASASRAYVALVRKSS